VARALPGGFMDGPLLPGPRIEVTGVASDGRFD
jgi:hypothetical protein